MKLLKADWESIRNETESQIRQLTILLAIHENNLEFANKQIELIETKDPYHPKSGNDYSDSNKTTDLDSIK